MFSKKNDIVLKIVNMILIIIATISLGVAVGTNYFDENYEGTFDCEVYDSNYNCKNYAIGEHINHKTMNIAYSIFGTSIVALIICNVAKGKN